jgi:type II restriction enzyme
MPRLTANNLVRAIAQLPKGVSFQYANKKTKNKILITKLDEPEGPIYFKRYDPTQGKTAQTAREESISCQLIWRIANALSTGQPVNLDRILGGSYNSRSVLEALLAHTPEFSMCYPGRVEKAGQEVTIRKGHKHIWWTPDTLHQIGNIAWVETQKVISEIPASDAIYEAIVIGEVNRDVPTDIQRRHAQIQIALVLIGETLGFSNSVAIQDQHIEYEGRRILERASVVKELGGLPQIAIHALAIEKIRHVDLVWFKNGRLMPAAIEIEHTTGIKSGLDRLKGLQDVLPPFPIRFVIAADEDLRDKVVQFSNEARFRTLNIRFFSYSAIEELYSLCMRRSIKGVTEEFLDSFMEPVLH